MVTQFIFGFILRTHYYFKPKGNVVICYERGEKEKFVRLLDYIIHHLANDIKL